MPNNELPAQGLYSPLSQNMTDSDSSEEEIHSVSASTGVGRQHNRNIKKSHGGGARKMSINTHILGSMHEINCNNYSNINSDGDEGSVHHHHHHNHMDADDVAILNRSTFKTKSFETMSPIRKCCFVTSILVCILTVVLFLWVIPCTDKLTCPAKLEHIKTKNWMRNYEKIELKGGINVVNGMRGRSKNLVFMYRGDKLWSEIEPLNNRRRNGIIALIGNTGQVSWYDEIVNEPSTIDCTLLDADQNGTPDCLVLDEFGELGCIDPVSGQWIWHIADRTTFQGSDSPPNFPLVLPDLNDDHVNELLVTSVQGNRSHLITNTLQILSGATGRTLGKPYTLLDCSRICKFQLDNQLRVCFNCFNNDTEIQKCEPLDKLYRLITNKSSNIERIAATINQHKFYGQRKDTLVQRNIYSISGKQLIVENNGKCPDNCNVTVQLVEQRNGKEHVIRNFNGSRMYGMVPALLSFNATAVNGKPSVHGFVIKLWEWSLNETDIQFQTRHKRNTKSTWFDDEYNRFASVLQRKASWSLPVSSDDALPTLRRRKRSDTAESTSSSPPPPPPPLMNVSSKESVFKSKMRLIKETVVLIVFNSTDTRIENTSQSNIIQFCRDERDAVACQPDLNYQENSVLIADLDQDGSQELVTYYTTFVNTGDETKMEWKLITYVQLLRLEAELPKLYVVNDAI